MRGLNCLPCTECCAFWRRNLCVLLHQLDVVDVGDHVSNLALHDGFLLGGWPCNWASRDNFEDSGRCWGEACEETSLRIVEHVSHSFCGEMLELWEAKSADGSINTIAIIAPKAYNYYAKNNGEEFSNTPATATNRRFIIMPVLNPNRDGWSADDHKAHWKINT